MEQYQQAVENVLLNGTHEVNRTDIDTIAHFNENYTIDVSDSFPLLTTKQMDTVRFDSMVHEFLWYLSGEHHIQELTEKTSIWDDWADENNNLPTAYGRFWRRFPIPDTGHHLNGEWWANNPKLPVQAEAFYDDLSQSEVKETLDQWVTHENGGTTFDQLQYVIDTLNGENPLRGPESRRLIVNAWHPANAAVSHLPPCHYTFQITVQNGKLNTHLTQRSADIALGVPFNIASYGLLTKVLENVTPFEAGRFGHTLVDCHVYCGSGDRSKWYQENLEAVRSMLTTPDTDWADERYQHTKEYIEANAPQDGARVDHLPNLLEQLSRKPYEQPTIDIANKPLDELEYEDITLNNYESHDALSFNVAV